MPRLSSILFCCAILTSAIILVFLYDETAKAQSAPPNLASMAKELWSQNLMDLSKSTGDKVQDEILRRTRKIFKDAGILRWAREEIKEIRAIANKPLPVVEKDPIGIDKMRIPECSAAHSNNIQPPVTCCFEAIGW